MADWFDDITSSSAGPSPQGGDWFDDITRPPAPAPKGKQNKNAIGDLVTDFKRGVEGLPGMATGLADLVATPVTAPVGVNRPFSRAADWLGEQTGFQPGQWAKAAQQEYTPGRQQARANIDKAWEEGGAGNIAGAYLTNPSQTIGSVVESLPGMAAGIGVGGKLFGLGAKAAGVGAEAAEAVPGYLAKRYGAEKGAAIAGGAGEGVVTAGQQMDQTSYDVNPWRAAAGALGAGAGTGLLGYAGGRLAHSLGLEDIDSAAIRRVSGDTTKQTGLGKRIAAGAISEGLLEELPQSMQEQMWQNWTEGKPIMEGVARAGVEGALSGALMGGAFNARSRKQQIQQDPNDTTQQTNLLLPPPAATGTLPANGMPMPNNPGGESVGMSQAERDNEEMWRQRNMQEHAAKTEAGETYDLLGGPSSVASPVHYGFNEDGSFFSQPIQEGQGQLHGDQQTLDMFYPNGEPTYAANQDVNEHPQAESRIALNQLDLGDNESPEAVARRKAWEEEQAFRQMEASRQSANVRDQIQQAKTAGVVDSAAGKGASQPTAMQLAMKNAKTEAKPEKQPVVNKALLQSIGLKGKQLAAVVQRLGGKTYDQFIEDHGAEKPKYITAVAEKLKALNDAWLAKQSAPATQQSAPATQQSAPAVTPDSEAQLRQQRNAADAAKLEAGQPLIPTEANATPTQQVAPKAPKKAKPKVEAQPAAAPAAEGPANTESTPAAVATTGNTARDIVAKHDIKTDDGVVAALRELSKDPSVPQKVAYDAEDALAIIEDAEDAHERKEEIENAGRKFLQKVAEHKSNAERKTTTKGEAPNVDGSLAGMLGVLSKSQVEEANTEGRALTKEFKTTKEAALWLAQNAEHAFIRFLMGRIANHVGEFPIRYAKLGEAYDVKKDLISERFMRGLLKGEAVISRDTGNGIINLHPDNGRNETTLAHELLHMATMMAVDANTAAAKKLTTLWQQVMHSMNTDKGRWPISDKAVERLQSQFKIYMKDADEFLAYAMTDPAFQKFLMQIGADGRWLNEYRTPEQKAAINRNAGYRKKQTKAVPDLSLFQKLVDFVRSLFNLPKVYAPKLAEVLAYNADVAANNYKAANPDYRTLGDELRDILGPLLDDNTAVLRSIDERNAKQGGVAGQSGAQDTGSGIKTTENVIADVRRAFSNTVNSSTATTAKDVARRAGLATIMLDQMVRMFEGTPIHKSMVEYLKRTGERDAQARKLVESARTISNEWTELGDNMGQQLTDALNEATLAESYGDQAFDHADNKHLESEDADTLAENKAAHAKAVAEYNKLNAKGKELYRKVLDIGKQWLKKEFELRSRAARDLILPDMKSLVTAEQFKQLEAIYADDNIGVNETRKQARELVKNNAKALQLVNELESMVDEQIGRLREMQGPYFPLMRFGDHIAVMKSKAYQAAEKAYDDMSEEIKKFRTDKLSKYDAAIRDAAEAKREYQRKPSKVKQDALAAARQTATNLKQQLAPEFKQLKDMKAKHAELFKSLSKMTQDDAHYVFEKHETEGGAQAAAANYKKRFPDADVKAHRASDYINAALPTSRSFISKLEEKLAKKLGADSEEFKRAKQAINSTFLDTTHDRSTLKRMLMKRKKVAGFSKDGQRVFASFVMQGAHRLANIEHFVPMQDALNAVAEKAHETADTAQIEASNELLKRFELDLKYEETPIQNWIAKINHAWTLGISPAYLLQQAAQTFMTSAPYMIGRHSFKDVKAETWKAWGEAKNIVADAIKKQGERYNIDIDALKLKDGEKSLLKGLFHAGLADILQEHDVGEIASGNKTALKINKVLDKVNWVARQMELHNRLTTALSAYRLEFARTGDQAASEAYAQKVVSDTQVNYSDANAGRIFKKNFMMFGKVLGQFKKYQVAMATTIATNAYKAFKGDEEARRIVLGMLTTHFMVTGVQGLSIYFPIKLLATGLAMLLGLAGAGDDDEPFDFDRWLKNFAADYGGDYGDVLMRGLPALANMDFSSSLGQGNIFNPLPFYRGSSGNGASVPKDVWQALAPPALGTASNIYRGAGDLLDGNFLDAWTKMTPRYIAGIGKGVKLATEGIQTKDGHTRIPAENFNTAEVVAQSLGLPLLSVRKYYEREQDFNELKAAQTKTRTEYIKEWQETGKVPDGVAGFNERHPDARITFKDVVARRKADKAYQKNVDPETGMRVGKKQQSIGDQIRY